MLINRTNLVDVVDALTDCCDHQDLWYPSKEARVLGRGEDEDAR